MCILLNSLNLAPVSETPQCDWKNNPNICEWVLDNNFGMAQFVWLAVLRLLLSVFVAVRGPIITFINHSFLRSTNQPASQSVSR